MVVVQENIVREVSVSFTHEEVVALVAMAAAKEAGCEPDEFQFYFAMPGAHFACEAKATYATTKPNTPDYVLSGPVTEMVEARLADDDQEPAEPDEAPPPNISEAQKTIAEAKADLVRAKVEAHDAPEQQAPMPGDDLTEMQKKLLKMLVKAAGKGGCDGTFRFSVSLNGIRDKAGIAQGSMNFLLSQLVEKGYIAMEKRGPKYDPFFTCMPCAGEVFEA